MKVSYYINSNRHSTNKTNNDLEIIETVDGERTIVKVKALKDLTLGNARINVKFDITFKDSGLNIQK